jgi:hypothetical protein
MISTGRGLLTALTTTRSTVEDETSAGRGDVGTHVTRPLERDRPRHTTPLQPRPQRPQPGPTGARRLPPRLCPPPQPATIDNTTMSSRTLPVAC